MIIWYRILQMQSVNQTYTRTKNMITWYRILKVQSIHQAYTRTKNMMTCYRILKVQSVYQTYTSIKNMITWNRILQMQSVHQTNTRTESQLKFSDDKISKMCFFYIFHCKISISKKVLFLFFALKYLKIKFNKARYILPFLISRCWPIFNTHNQ